MMEVKENSLLNSLSDFGIELSDSLEAIRSISNLSFPTRKTEDWKYSPINKIIKKDYVQIEDEKAINLSKFLIPDLDAHLVVLVNGIYSEGLSSKPQNNIIIESLSKALNDKRINLINKFNKIANNAEEVFTAVNTGYFKDGILVYIPKNEIADKPVHILHIVTENKVVSNPRFLIVAEPFAELNIIQSYASENVSDCFVNTVTEVFVEQNAKVVIDKLQVENPGNSHICSENIHQEKDSYFKINTFTISGDFVRNGLTIDVDGENCTSEMNGMYLLSGTQHVDNHTKVNHKKPNCTSSELYKGVLYDKATGVFNGKVIVFEDAQKIEAYQQNKNILISPNASMNAKPELEIYADDVKCSHGTTTGQFDEEAIFYLQARGVSKDAAKKMLVDAFAEEVIQKVDNSTLKAWLMSSN